MNTRSRLSVLAAVPLLLTGCGGGGGGGGGEAAGGEGAPVADSFTAQVSGDAVRVCGGAAMSNAGSYDPSAPGVVIFELAQLSGSDQWTNRMTPSDHDAPLVDPEDGDDLAAITVVACAIGVEAHREDAIDCETDEGATFRLAPIDWRLELREAATGEVIATSDDLPTSPLGYCPFKSDPDEFEPGPGDADATLALTERLLAQG